jgi:hypothetical protein
VLEAAETLEKEWASKFEERNQIFAKEFMEARE